jgi:tetratricopeptide (TPR) repeat protein
MKREEIAWPLRVGLVPPLADRFSTRPESAPDIRTALAGAGSVVLAADPVQQSHARHGPASCGKTQLAVYYAESLWQSRAVELLVWTAATSREAVLSAYAEAALHLTELHAVGDAERLATEFLGWLAGTRRRWLIVLDDLADSRIVDGLWPEGPTGRTLITSAGEADLAVDGRALVLPVGPFSPREAMSYLVSRLAADPDQRRGAMDLVDVLGRDLQALALATATIAGSWHTCHDYCENFVQLRNQMGAASGVQPPPSEVAWWLALERACQMVPGSSARAGLAIASFLDAHAIPASVFTAAAARKYLTGQDGNSHGAIADPAVLALERVGLLALDQQITPPLVRMSQVVQSYVRSAMPADVLEEMAVIAADALLEVWPADDAQAWLAQSLRSSATTLQQVAGDALWAGGCHRLLIRAGDSLDAARLAESAVRYWLELATTSGRLLGPGHPDSMALAERVVGAYIAAGRAADAVAWCQQAAAEKAAALGPNHPVTIAAQVLVGRTMVAAGQPADAVTVLAGVVKYSEGANGPDDASTVAAREGLAAACSAAGRFKDAVHHYRLVLGQRERQLGSTHIETLNDRGNLASTLHAAGKIKEAIPLFEKTLAARESVQGTDHPDTLTARASLAAAYHSAGRLAIAIGMHESAVAGYDKVLGPYHRNTLTARANLSMAYYAAHRNNEAISLLERTLSDCQRALPQGHPLLKSVQESLEALK